MGIRIFLEGEDEAGVQFERTDDFYYFRDSIHAALEDGEFGCRFPTFLLRFEGEAWALDQLQELQRELEAIAAAFRRLPPRPPDPHWASRVAASGRRPASLYDVFVDHAGAPALGRLIALCRAARDSKKTIHID